MLEKHATGWFPTRKPSGLVQQKKSVDMELNHDKAKVHRLGYFAYCSLYLVVSLLGLTGTVWYVRTTQLSEGSSGTMLAGAMLFGFGSLAVFSSLLILLEAFGRVSRAVFRAIDSHLSGSEKTHG